LELETAFDHHQTAVNADPAAVKEARRRRDLFKEALAPEDDVTETFPSGSLARGSQIDPINDVDFVAVYDPEAHPDWGSPGSSAEDALRHVGGRVNQLLGATNGTVAKEVRLASPRNHVVKCFLDDPDDPNAFTVDVMLLFQEAVDPRAVQGAAVPLLRRPADHGRMPDAAMQRQGLVGVRGTSAQLLGRSERTVALVGCQIGPLSSGLEPGHHRDAPADLPPEL
jgi:hypothetical protein